MRIQDYIVRYCIPEAQSRFLQRLSDNDVKLAHAALFADLGTPGFSLEDETRRDRWARVRRNAPALAALTDAELNIVLDAAQRLDWDVVAADTPAILKNLQLDAIKIVVWSEVLEGIDDWESPPAVAVHRYIEALAWHQATIVCESSDRLDRAHGAMDAKEAREITAAWRDVEATLAPEKIAEVRRYIDGIDDRWQQVRLRFGDPTAKGSEGRANDDE